MEFVDLPVFYKNLDEKFFVTNGELESATYTNVDSNFVFSAKYARHRWFNYKEGFSPILVEKLFDEYGLNEKSVVCDPFCGAGTTLAVAKTKGMHSIGFEVNPFAAFITKIKTENYEKSDIDEFKKLLINLGKKKKCEELPLTDNDYLNRIFESEMLNVQLNIRKYISDIAQGKARDLLFFAWICTLEECSLYRKAGNGLKIKKNAPAYKTGEAFQFAYEKIQKKADSMIEDYSAEDNGPIPALYVDSVTTMKDKVPDKSVDFVLFSPPCLIKKPLYLKHGNLLKKNFLLSKNNYRNCNHILNCSNYLLKNQSKKNPKNRLQKKQRVKIKKQQAFNNSYEKKKALGTLVSNAFIVYP